MFIYKFSFISIVSTDLCERQMTEIPEVKKNVPNKIKVRHSEDFRNKIINIIQGDVNVTEHVLVYVGLTKKEILENELGAYDIFKGENPYHEEIVFHAEKVLIHPKLQTSEVGRI